VVGRGRFESVRLERTLELRVKLFKYPRKDVLESGEGAFLKWLMKWSNEDEARSRGPPGAAALAVLLANTATGGFSGEKGGEGVSVSPSVGVGDMAGDDGAVDDADAAGKGEAPGGTPGGTRGAQIIGPTPPRRFRGGVRPSCGTVESAE
jgi:hypothetical protein